MRYVIRIEGRVEADESVFEPLTVERHPSETVLYGEVADQMQEWVDATDVDVVFYGIDYLALLDLIADERYDASNPDKPADGKTSTPSIQSRPPPHKTRSRTLNKTNPGGSRLGCT